MFFTLIFCYYNFCTLSDPIKWGPILDQFSMITRPYTRPNGLKTIPFPAAHTRIANIWEYPPWGVLGFKRLSISMIRSSWCENMAWLIVLNSELNLTYLQTANSLARVKFWTSDWVYVSFQVYFNKTLERLAVFLSVGSVYVTYTHYVAMCIQIDLCHVSLAYICICVTHWACHMCHYVW